MLSDKQIKRFKSIYRDRYDEKITMIEAQEKGIKFIHFFQLLYGPITKEQYNTYKKIKNEINKKKIP